MILFEMNNTVNFLVIRVSVLQVVVVGNDMKLDIEFQQVSDDVVLDTTIVRNDLGGLALVEHANALGGYLLTRFNLLGSWKGDLFLLWETESYPKSHRSHE